MKRIVGLFIVLMLVFIITPKIVMAEEDNKTIISSDQSALLANVNDEMIISDYVYQHSKNVVVPLGDVTLTSFSDDLLISAGKIKVTKKGIHRMLLQYESANFYVYVIAKETADTEYILFSEDFTGMPNGQLPLGFVSLGSSGISNERLFLDGSGGSSKVLLPAYLRMFSNYIIETDMTILEANNNSRWASVMFRYREENYYQMAIRQEATLANGVEFAKRINGNWNVTDTKSFTEDLSPAKMYNLKIDVVDSKITEYMNGELINVHEQAFEFKKGDIGFQADGSKVVFDNIKITLPVNYIREESHEFTKIPIIYEPNTKIVNPATVVVELQSKAHLNDLVKEKRPATVLFKVDNDLNVIAFNDEKVDTLYNFLIKIDGLLIPAFYTNDLNQAEEIALKLKDYGILDVFLMSSEKAVILKARDTYEMVRGILDASNNEKALTKENLNEIRFLTNESQAVAAVFNVNKITKEAVNYLQQRGMTVWTKADKSSHYKAILSGVNGIVTDDFLDVFSIYETFQSTTHVREVFIISHRGLHNGYTNSDGPENTIEVALAAVSRGAKIIEIDIHLTKDEKIVVMHDDTTNRTSDIPVVLRDQLYDHLLYIPLRDVSNTGKEYFLPSFEDYLKTFKDTGVVIFVEIKPTNALLLEKAKELIDQYEMAENINYIAFGAENIKNMKDIFPAMSNGYLTGALLSSNLNDSLLNVLTSIVPMKSTLNPSHGPLTKEFTSALAHRGITIWPWTIDENSSIEYFYEAGVGGITTNVSDYMKDALLQLKYDKTTYKVALNEKDFSVIGKLVSLSGEEYTHRGELVILNNDAEAVFDSLGNLVSVNKTGKVEFYVIAETQTPSGKPIFVTSDLMTIEIVKDGIFSNPWILVGSGLVVLVLGASIAIYFIRKKK